MFNIFHALYMIHEWSYFPLAQLGRNRLVIQSLLLLRPHLENGFSLSQFLLLWCSVKKSFESGLHTEKASDSLTVTGSSLEMEEAEHTCKK